MFVNHSAKSHIAALDEVLEDTLDRSVGVHLLPFWRSDGDGGFAVNSWTDIETEFGTQEDIASIASKRTLQVDGIYNHVSWRHPIAKKFLSDPVANSHLVHAVPGSELPRGPLAPRGGSVYRKREIGGGTWYIWQTFGADAVDVNLHDAEVRQGIMQNLELLANMGVDAVRLDALPYYGKRGTVSPLHNPDGLEAAEFLVKKVRELGMQPVLQIDCDATLEIYSSLNPYNLEVIDFSYDTYLWFALVTGDPTELAIHLEKTQRYGGVGIQRPLRTHDGILLRSGNQPANFVSRVIDECSKEGLYVRITNDIPYELNNSLPFLLEGHFDKELYFRKLLMGIIAGVLTSETTYIYLGALVGDVPEIMANFGDDPRDLQRRPIDVNGLRMWREASQVRNHINLLGIISADAPADTATRKSYTTTVRGGLLTIENSAMGLRATLNFSSLPHPYVPSGQGILSAGLEAGIMWRYGYEVSRTRKNRDVVRHVST